MIFNKLKPSFLPALPLLLLLLAVSTVFLFGNDRGQFYRPGPHNAVSANHLVVAANLSPEHNFLLFYYQTLDKDGAPAYRPYSRFPLGGYALIKLAIVPFGNDFSAQIHAARLMFLLFFAGSAILAYLSLCRLTANRWIALTASLLAFSSYYLLYYNDMVATENGLSLFGVLLTFHGMVVFVREGRFRQLLIKACAALLLGWHVYALLLPFIVLGMANELIRLCAGNSAPRSMAGQLKRCGAALLFSRYLRLGVVTLLFGMALLSFNLGNEYRALDGEVPLTELPTVKSMTYRLGADDAFNERYAKTLAWGNFLENQFYRIARATLPFSISPFDNGTIKEDKDYLGMLIGALATGIAIMGLLFARHKMLLATLALSGFCWALPMRHSTAFHDFESVFYIGVPLVLFAMGLSGLHRLFGERLLAGLSAAALLVFILSSFQMGRVGHDRQAAEFQEVVVADIEHIRTITEAGQSVFVSPPIWNSFDYQGMTNSLHYYLAGRVFGTPGWLRDNVALDFLILRQRVDVPALLTPDNRQIFLYRKSGYSAQIDEMIRQSELVIRRDGYFVYRYGNSLIYDPNQGENRAAQFKWDIPIVGKRFATKLSPAVRRAGFTDRSAWQWERGSDAEGWTNVSGSDHPGRPHVYTPTTVDVGRQLRAFVHYTDSQGNRVKAMTLPSLPVQPSSAIDRGFFLHVIPVDVDDLPDHRKQYGFDNLDFRFDDYALPLIPVDVDDLPDHRKQYGFDNLDFRFDDYALPLTERPVAVRELPDYPITRIHTGQLIVNEDGSYTHPWEGEIRFDEPLIRSNFDVYLDEDKLTYIKEPCAPADTQAGFFLHLMPADVADLPAARKQHGFDNLDFRFNHYGIRSGEQCVARRELPDYDFTGIRTGQFLINEDGFYTNIWEGEIRFDE